MYRLVHTARRATLLPQTQPGPASTNGALELLPAGHSGIAAGVARQARASPLRSPGQPPPGIGIFRHAPRAGTMLCPGASLDTLAYGGLDSNRSADGVDAGCSHEPPVCFIDDHASLGTVNLTRIPRGCAVSAGRAVPAAGPAGAGPAAGPGQHERGAGCRSVLPRPARGGEHAFNFSREMLCTGKPGISPAVHRQPASSSTHCCNKALSSIATAYPMVSVKSVKHWMQACRLQNISPHPPSRSVCASSLKRLLKASDDRADSCCHGKCRCSGCRACTRASGCWPAAAA